MKTIALAALLVSAATLAALAPAASARFCTVDPAPIDQCGGVLTQDCVVELSGEHDGCLGPRGARASTGLCAGDYQVSGAGCLVDTRDAGVHFRDCHDGTHSLWIGNAQTSCDWVLP